MFLLHRSVFPCLVFLLSLGAGGLSTNVIYSQEKAVTVKALQKERRDLLEEVVEQMQKRVRTGMGESLQELIQVERDFFKADLELLEKPEERIEAIQRHKTFAELILKRVEASVEAGRELKARAIQAKAFVLEMQIELLREQEKQKSKAGK